MLGRLFLLPHGDIVRVVGLTEGMGTYRVEKFGNPFPYDIPAELLACEISAVTAVCLLAQRCGAE